MTIEIQGLKADLLLSMLKHVFSALSFLFVPRFYVIVRLLLPPSPRTYSHLKLPQTRPWPFSGVLVLFEYAVTWLMRALGTWLGGSFPCRFI